MASSCLHTFEEYTPQKFGLIITKIRLFLQAMMIKIGIRRYKQVRVSKKYLKANGKSVVLDNIRKPKGVGLKLMSDYTNT